jgi:hypothetical protein
VSKLYDIFWCIGYALGTIVWWGIGLVALAMFSLVILNLVHQIWTAI